MQLFSSLLNVQFNIFMAVPEAVVVLMALFGMLISVDTWEVYDIAVFEEIKMYITKNFLHT